MGYITQHGKSHLATHKLSVGSLFLEGFGKKINFTIGSLKAKGVVSGPCARIQQGECFYKAEGSKIVVGLEV